jgi:hypothetical protein
MKPIGKLTRGQPLRNPLSPINKTTFDWPSREDIRSRRRLLVLTVFSRLPWTSASCKGRPVTTGQESAIIRSHDRAMSKSGWADLTRWEIVRTLSSVAVCKEFRVTASDLSPEYSSICPHTSQPMYRGFQYRHARLDGVMAVGWPEV